MLCDKYKEALIEAAANGSALSTEIGEHVNLCARCGEVFAGQQSLYALVDAGLRCRATGPVPGNFDQRVRAAVAMQGSRKQKAYSVALGFASLAAAAAVLMAILLTWNVRREGKGTVRGPEADGTLVSSARPLVSPVSPRSSSPANAPSRRTSATLSRGRQTRREQRDVVEILVPAGQEELLGKYMEGFAAQRGRLNVAAGVHEPDINPLEFPSIEISELVVKPLPDLSSN